MTDTQIVTEMAQDMTKRRMARAGHHNNNAGWLSGLSLVKQASLDVVSAIAAFLDKVEPERVERARSEVERVLRLIADTAGDEEVREAASRPLTSKQE